VAEVVARALLAVIPADRAGQEVALVPALRLRVLGVAERLMPQRRELLLGVPEHSAKGARLTGTNVPSPRWMAMAEAECSNAPRKGASLWRSKVSSPASWRIITNDAGADWGAH